MLVDVALPVPLFRTFSYRVPEGLTGSVEPGARVVVPFRNRREIGIVFGSAEPREGVKYKDILAAPDDDVSVDPPMLALCQWIADYYVVPLGVALRCALPAALTGAAAPVPSRKTQRVLQLGHELPSLLRRDRSSRARRNSARSMSCLRRSADARRSSICTSSSRSQRQCCADW